MEAISFKLQVCMFLTKAGLSISQPWFHNPEGSELAEQSVAHFKTQNFHGDIYCAKWSCYLVGVVFAYLFCFSLQFLSSLVSSNCYHHGCRNQSQMSSVLCQHLNRPSFHKISFSDLDQTLNFIFLKLPRLVEHVFKTCIS